MRNKSLITAAVLLLISTSVYSQPSFDTEVDDVAPIPGILIAIAVAIGLGVMRKLRSEKHQ